MQPKVVSLWESVVKQLRGQSCEQFPIVNGALVTSLSVQWYLTDRHFVDAHTVHTNDRAGNTEGGSITLPLNFYLTRLDRSVLQIKTKIVSCHTADSTPVKQEVNGTVIPPPLVFPGEGHH